MNLKSKIKLTVNNSQSTCALLVSSNTPNSDNSIRITTEKGASVGTPVEAGAINDLHQTITLNTSSDQNCDKDGHL